MLGRDFREGKSISFCPNCGHEVFLYFWPHPGDKNHPGGVRCAECGRFLFWFKKDRNESKRALLKKGTIPEVWTQWGDHCGHCGTSKENLIELGISLTVQHIPPYKEGGENLIPLCAWCQQDSSSWQKRMQFLIRRILEKK